ncbi:hypothetical protein C8R43DRAFT_1043136 [Mycena crocata]|nr:hypothetical protein C8R43DRAFT_1043136 [Mycena crocata]
MQMTDDPYLPLELERQIFEMAAHIRPLSILTLMLVASRVKIWLEPLLYRTISVSMPPLDVVQGHLNPSWETLIPAFKSKSIPFLRHSVRNLFIYHDVPEEHSEWLLHACSGIEDLYIWSADHIHPSTLADLRLKRIHCVINYLFGHGVQIDFTHSFFSHLTHIDVFDSISDIDMWTQLSLIPHLTHLAFNGVDSVPLFLCLLRACASLRVLVVLNPGPPDADMAQLSEDTRFVLTNCTAFFQDWQMGAHAGIDFWSRAEDLIAKRRSGEIPAAEVEY